MITLSAARLVLYDPARLSTGLPALLDEIEALPAADLDDLAPLVFDVIGLSDRALSVMALKRILTRRPDWLNTKEDFAHCVTPLISAVKNGCLATVSLLLDARADAHAVDARGMNALDYAARHVFAQPESAHLCEALLEKGGFTQQQKDCALYYAGDSGALNAVLALLTHGADFTETTQKGTSLGAACLGRISRPHCSAVEIVRAMLQTSRGLQVIDQGWDFPDDGYGAPIHCAAGSGNLEVLSVLVDAGAHVNPPPDRPHDSPTTPLMSAALVLNLEAIEFLISAGAAARLVNAKGHNALHHLAHADPDINAGPPTDAMIIKMVDALVAAGADPLAVDVNGLTPQAAALESGNSCLAALAEYLATITSARGLSSGTSDPDRKAVAAPGRRL